MNKVRTIFLTLVVIAALAGTALAQGAPRGTSKLNLGGKALSVEYGRPSLAGRTVEQLVGQLPPGGIWRLGADTSTTFSADMDLVVGGTNIPKGEYSIWARKEADNGWKLVFNKQHGQWGTEHDAPQDLAAVPLKESKAFKAQEQLRIELAKTSRGGTISIEWGETRLSADFKSK